MENSILYDNRRVLKLIKLLFKITLFFLILIFCLPWVLKINHSISFADGVVYSKTPKTKIIAPTEVTIEAIKIKEGQKITKGDTLLLLKSEKIRTQYETSNIERISIEDQILGLEHQITLAKAKKESYKALNVMKSTFESENKHYLVRVVKNYRDKWEVSIQQKRLAENKYQTDSILFEKGIISRIEFEKQKNKFLEVIAKELEIQLGYNKKRFELKKARHTRNKNENKSTEALIDIDKQIINYEFELKVLKSKLNNSLQDLNYIVNKKDRLIILAPVSGSISFLFNTQFNVNILSQGTPLITITPNSEEYYIKTNLPEENLIHVTKNQDVILKANAYSYLKYGGLKGKVSYVSPSAVDKEFYCIIDIKDYNPNIILKQDYKITGDIIIGKLRLYEYVFKILFDKI